ncbi:MAG TPA: M20 family metallopeptidase [Flavitalea sp.]|nr:M20 family metallopeptidase [Flavitalea sp.]
MHDLKEKIRQQANLAADEIIFIRRYLHAHPELSYQEFETASFISAKLTEYGIPFQRMANTGVIGLIEGRSPGKKIIALRGDMDALPIHEENNIEYRSVKAGIMHACGHDVHTACLLGASKILNNLKDQWEGSVKVIFQPGEERNPGGASLLIKEGVLKNPTPDAIFALHVHPGLPVGKVSLRSGQVMASADEIYITLKGKGGHAAAPHLTTDTILAASELIVALQQVISRNRNPLSPSVLSICSIQGGHTTNVIPSEVKLMGTFRALDEEWRFTAHKLIEKICRGIAESTGASIDCHIDVGYPAVYNHELLHPVAVQLAQDYMGEQDVWETEMRMGAEDFGYYSQKIPGCFFRLGVMNEKKGITAGVHTPTFNVDESAIEIGMGMMAWLGAAAKFPNDK